MAAPSFPDGEPPRAAIIAAARRWLGTPYRHQGARLGVGADCLGVVLGVWREVYRTTPRHPSGYSPDWAEAARGEPMLGYCRDQMREVPTMARRPGDLVVFRWSAHVPAKHLGVLVAAQAMVEARERHAVSLTTLTPWWTRRIAAVFAFPPLATIGS